MGVSIRKIILKNFRIHSNLELEFSDGTNIIIGENGTGKSSVFLGIIFALFGLEALTSYEKGGRKENLVRKGAGEGYVELYLDKDGEQYAIRREIVSGVVILKKYIDGKWKIIASGKENVEKIIKNEILGISDYKRFSNVFYIRQRALGNLVLEMGKKGILEKLEEILNIKKYGEVSEILKSVIEVLHTRLSEMKINYRRRKENLKRLIKDKNIEDLEKLYEERKKLEEKIRKLRELRVSLLHLKKFIDQELLKREEELQNDLEKILEELSKIDEEIENLEEELGKYNILTNDFDEYIEWNLEKLEEEIKKYEDVNLEEKELLRNKLLEIKRILKMIGERNLEEELKNIENEIDNINSRIEQANKSIGFLNKKINDLNKITKILKETSEPECPVCGSKIENPEQLYKEKLMELTETKRTLEHIKRELIELQNKKRELERKKEEINNILNKIRELSPEEDIKTTLKKVLEKLNRIEKYEKIYSAIAFQKKQEIQKRLKNNKEKRIKLEEKRNKILIQLTKISEMKKKVLELEKIKAELEALGIKEEELKEKIEELEEKYSKLPEIGKEVIQYVKSEVKNLELLEKRIEELEKYLSKLEKAYKVLFSLKYSIRKIVAEKLTAYINYWFKKLYIYPDIEEVMIKVTEGRTDFVYNLYVVRNLEGKRVVTLISEAGLSGGQIVILDLALRLALASFLSTEVRFLLLDEPTESLDEKVRQRLAEILSNLPEKQLIICSHDNIFLHSLSGKGYRFERDSSGKIVVKEIA